jgi:hypothetical protein
MLTVEKLVENPVSKNVDKNTGENTDFAGKLPYKISTGLV